MTEKDKDWEATLRDQINEVFRSAGAVDGVPDEVWAAVEKAGAFAAHIIHRHVGEVITENDSLPDNNGNPSELMGLVPGAQFLMVTIGTAGALLDTLLGSIEVKIKEADGGLDLNAEDIKASCRVAIESIRLSTRASILSDMKANEDEEDKP